MTVQIERVTTTTAVLPTCETMLEVAQLRLDLAEEAEAAAAYVLADAVSSGRDEVDVQLLVREFRRAQADALLALAVYEATGVDHRASA